MAGMTKTILKTKYANTLALIEKENKHDNGEPYDMDVCLDMLISDLKSVRAGEPCKYPFDGIVTFDFEEFGKDYDSLE